MQPDHPFGGQRMWADILETPDVVDRLLCATNSLLDPGSQIVTRRWSRIVFTGRGSSEHAAIVAEAVLPLGDVGGPTVQAPSVLAHGDLPADLSDWLVVAVSQSGATPEVVAAARRAAARGAQVIGVTNEPDSPLADAATTSILLAAAPERVIAATKTVTAQVTALLRIAQALGSPSAPSPEQWADLPADLDRALRAPVPTTGRLAVAVLGRGITIGVAREGALKIMETSARPVYGGSAYDFLHGPAAMLSESTCAVMVPSSAHDRETFHALQTVASQRGAEALLLNEPDSRHPWITAIRSLVQVQRFAIQQAALLGEDPDDPRGLRKVTETA